MSTLRVESLSARHAPAGPDVIDQVSFELPVGSITALLGASGCGKSTMLRVIAGLHPAGGGKVLLDGRDLGPLPPEQRPIATVLQGLVDFPHMTVAENVEFALRAARVPPGPARQRATQALGIAGLSGVADRIPAALPEGQRQLLALARAIAQQRPVLLLDEPLSNVDPRSRRALRDQMRGIVRRLGLTVLYATHDRGEALAVSDTIVLMDAGRIVESGTPQQIYRNPRTPFAAGFMGDSTLLPARRGEDGVVRLGALALPQLPGGPSGPVLVSFRPEAWRLAPAHEHGLPGCIARRNFLGRLVEYTVETEFGRVLVHAPYRGSWLDRGAPVTLRLAPAAALWIAQDGA